MTDKKTLTEERLPRFLARAGIASRRQTEQIIREGRVTLNGKIVLDPGTRINSKKDAIKVDGKRIVNLPAFVYILLNKPPGVVCTMKDPEERPCVGDLLKKVKGKPIPVGRLDYDTEGLLLCTNDGDLAHRLCHPRYKVKKTYNVKIKGIPEPRALISLQKGVYLDKKKTLPAKVSFIKRRSKNSWIRITIYEGRNRQVKRMLEKVGYRVLKLKRIALGTLTLEGLDRGAYRKLRSDELHKLKEYIAGLDKK